MKNPTKQIVVGITGASGAAYSQKLVRALCDGGAHVHLIVTPHGRRLFLDELDLPDVDATTLLGGARDNLTVYPYRDVGAKLGSGSFITDGMIICPCSSNTLAAVSCGLADNLLDRAAAVTLKEKRRLILVPREMPMSQIDLENSLRLSRSGAVICPASPGFYMLPKTIDDLVDFVVGKLLDLVEVPHQLNTRWKSEAPSPKSPWQPTGVVPGSAE